MAIIPEVQELADRFRAVLPGTLTSLPVDRMRATLEAANFDTGIDVHRVEARTVDGPRGPIPVRIYRPDGRRDLPVVLWFHGGGFALGSLNTGDDLCRRLCLGVEAVVVNVDYRLAPEHRYPAGLDDCAAVLTWVQASGATEGFDSDRVALAGDSAGGTLAMALSLRCRDSGLPPPRCQVNIYGSADMVLTNPEFGDLPFLDNEDVEWFWATYLADPAQRDDPYVNPARASDHGNLPPLICITAGHDPTRDGAETYAATVAAAGVETEVWRAPGMHHGFFNRPDTFGEAATAHRKVTLFLRRFLGRARTDGAGGGLGLKA